MKFIYLIKSYAMKAGVERVMSDKMNYLAARGHAITLVTYEQGSHPQAFPLHESIRHVDLGTRFFEIEKYGLVRRLPLLSRLRRVFKDRLQSIVDEVQPDVIVSTTYSAKLMDIILSVNTHARQVVESHVACFTIKKAYDYRHQFLLRHLAALYDKWMLGKLAKADCLIALTEGDAQDWKQYISEVLVIPNPVTDFRDEVKPHDGEGHRILCVGRLHEQKGFDMLVDAFALISEKCPQWRVDIFGDGSQKSLLLAKIEKYHLNGRITIHPPSPDIYTEYQNSEFLVLSSRYEGFALVLPEAMSCGIPCVAFDCKYGPRDVIAEGETGLLAADGNVEDLAEKMLWMVTHKEERLRMGRKARESVCRYQKDVIMQRWIDLFETLSASSLSKS